MALFGALQTCTVVVWRVSVFSQNFTCTGDEIWRVCWRSAEVLLSGECLCVWRPAVKPADAQPLLCVCLCVQTVLLGVLMLPVLRWMGLRAFSMATQTYSSGTHSAAFVTCPNDTVAKELARYTAPNYCYFLYLCLDSCQRNISTDLKLFENQSCMSKQVVLQIWCFKVPFQ